MSSPETTRDKPAWLRVIEHWCAKPGRTGPTLPYVFGAIRTPPGAPVADEPTARAEFDALLDAMDGYDYPGKYFSVRRCSIIGQLIVALEHQQSPTTGPWASFDDEVGNLQISIAGLSQTDARTELWRLSRADILAAHYSYSDGAFREFSPIEHADIRDALTS